mmetsp:Transcript_28829/g.50736  ORF Transcript_28829/g.50736 Transcript_28829/m.50736 type:complete len:433 (+) Transcript_28829:201-1499(+)|eukprot:CAMPEP_0197526920 /NCGR_PEP_ID=MMETSP1318-20131121/19737_1 /TAXON_ID=552666 /ORGANISM="Partenskyella glossopodia, Strain RCC365" /LENGTH=432 /DNA_ID=CAMNT_0043081315 /DNA_START=199 /DNA_END=1500 /DNA_ORIENTATION=+
MSTAQIVFNKFDTDNSGSIDVKEFQALCYNLGYMLTQAEIKYAVLSLDKDGSGQIESGEFQQWWGSYDRWTKLFLDDTALKQRTAAANVFRRFDPTGSGNIRNCDFEELHHTLTEFGLTSKDVSTCQKDLDSNRDGTIQFAEYIEWLGRQYNWAAKIPGASSASSLVVATSTSGYDSKTRTRGISQPNLDKIEAIPSRKVLMIVNHFVVSTTDFVNKLLVHAEQKLARISLDVQRLEILLRILEGKLDSIDWLQGQVKKDAPADSNAAPASAASASVPPPPSGVPAPPSGAVPPTPGVPPPPGSAPGAPAAPAPAAAAPPPAVEAGPKLKDDPRFVKYFRMVKLGVPPPVVEMKMKTEGFDPQILQLDPEGPASAADALAGAPATAPPPVGSAPAPAPSANSGGIGAAARALVKVRNADSDSSSEASEFDDD